jgi:hypothetical protein
MDASMVTEIHSAMAAMGAITGMSFVYRGPFAGDPNQDLFDEEVQFNIGSEGWFQNGGIVGVGRTWGHNWVTTHGNVELWSGLVGTSLLRNVLLHEIGHVVGLSHVDNAAEVMNPVAQVAPTAYGTGDTFGLRHLGLEAGCTGSPTPPPTPPPTPTPNQMPSGGIVLSVTKGRDYGLLGWAVDPETGGPVRMRVTISGVVSEEKDWNYWWEDMPSLTGVNRKESLVYLAQLPPGTRDVCFDGQDPQSGAWVNLGCRSVTVK